ncbi:unnamed protein product [Boreogadus saida]
MILLTRSSVCSPGDRRVDSQGVTGHGSPARRPAARLYRRIRVAPQPPPLQLGGCLPSSSDWSPAYGQSCPAVSSARASDSGREGPRVSRPVGSAVTRP